MSYGDYLREKTISEERAQACKLLLRDEVGLVEGVRNIVSRTRLLGFVSDSIDQVIEQIDLQSKHLPLGECRKKYSDSELRSLDKERQIFERDHRDSVNECCRQILERTRVVHQP